MSTFVSETLSAEEQKTKRDRAAALQNAGAMNFPLLLPRGLGVRRPYAASGAQAATFVGLIMLSEMRFSCRQRLLDSAILPERRSVLEQN